MLEKLWRSLADIPAISIGQAFWYLMFASATWLFFHVLFRGLLARRKIRRGRPTWRQLGWEVLYSLRSLVVFGMVGGFIAFAARMRWTQLYFRLEQHSLAWYFVSIGLMIVVHDAYFYWTHRLMHHPRLFRRVHRVHHLSTDPSPWAAYSFSSLEALVQAGIGPLVIFTIPAHHTAFLLFMVWQITFNVFGHCGYEIWPRWFMRCGLGKFINSPTHHAMHHETFRANFGLYFNVWDRLMGTNYPEYEARFAQVTASQTQ
jgi:sterol desaturase/sphingolipid hydroxylase (fatty acid hydroxylase superfamily)